MERLVYAVAVESALKRGLSGRLTPLIRTRLRELGIDLDVLKPSYPLAIYERGLKMAAALAYPELAEAVAMRRIGCQAIKHYEETTIGRMMVKLCRLLGPHRVLERAKTQFRAVANHLECTTTKVGPCAYDFWINGVGERVPYFEGVVSTMLELSGAKNVLVKETRRQGESVTFRISWSE